MMYNQKLVASLKANGKILREFKDTVYIPFGSEYSLLVKNLNTMQALVNIFIDGENVVEGGLVIAPGREIDLERYVKNNNLNEGNKFKFIERSDAVEQHRGIKLEDGLIRLEYRFQTPYQQTAYRTPLYIRSGDIMNPGGPLMSTTGIMNPSTAISCSTQSLNNVGITVPGSVSEQKFQTVDWFALENEVHTIVLRLLGETPDNKPVVKPVTVNHKPKCVTCGKQNKATDKFCSVCGTSLEVFA